MSDDKRNEKNEKNEKNMDTTGAAVDAAPLVRVVAGNPTAEELAVVVAVLAAAASAGSAAVPDAAPASQWTSRERAVRISPRPTAGGWRASAFPGTV